MIATSGWNGNGNGTNSSGFAALPAGGRHYHGAFYEVGYDGFWWSSTENIANYAWCRNVNYYYIDVYRDMYLKEIGLSVRCVRD